MGKNSTVVFLLFSVISLGVIWIGSDAPLLAQPGEEQARPPANLPAQNPQSAEAQGIHRSEQAFVQAFNRGDVGAIGALMTADCDYADEPGNIYHGRKEIEREYANFFARNPGAMIKTHINAIRIISPDAAIEDGTATVTLPKGPSSTSQYRVVHVRQNGRWLMASIRDTIDETPSHYANLQDFEWVIGNWIAKGDGREVHTTFRWMDNKNFIQRTYTVRTKDGVVSSGMQIIGWNPESKHVVSWTFDSTGGYGHGVWRPMPNGWSVASTGVTSDGTPVSSTEISTRTDDNHFTWQSVNRMAEGTSLPDMEKVVVERVKAKG